MTREKNDAARVDSGDGGALLESGSSGEGSSSGDSLAGGEPAGRKHDSNDGPTLDTLKAGQCAIVKVVRGHEAALANMRFSFIERLCARTIVRPHESREHVRSVVADRILTGRFTAIPCFILIMGFVFLMTFS